MPSKGLPSRSSIALVAALAIGGLAQVEGMPALSQVYTNGDASGWPCYRQPVVAAWDQTVLAFVEGRNNTCCWCTKDGYPKGIVVRRSTDGGQTFAPAQTLWVGGPDFFVAARDASSDKVFVFIQEGNSVLLTTSTDGGASWTSASPIKLDGGGFSTFKPAVGTGIQLDATLCAATDANQYSAVEEGALPAWHGRLVLPFVCAGRKGSSQSTAAAEAGDVKCPGCYSCLLLSDDGGASWRAGAVSPQDGTREASVVQTCATRHNATEASSSSSSLSLLRARPVPAGSSLTSDGPPDAVVFLSERNMGSTAGHRLWAESADGGETIATWGEDEALVSPVTANWTGIVGAVARTGGVVAYSGPMRGDARAQLGVRASRNDAQSWSAQAKVLWEGPAGYSDVVPLNTTHLGVIFEAGQAHFAEGIKLAAVEVASLPLEL